MLFIWWTYIELSIDFEVMAVFKSNIFNYLKRKLYKKYVKWLFLGGGICMLYMTECGSNMLIKQRQCNIDSDFPWNLRWKIIESNIPKLANNSVEFRYLFQDRMPPPRTTLWNQHWPESFIIFTLLMIFINLVKVSLQYVYML